MTKKEYENVKETENFKDLQSGCICEGKAAACTSLSNCFPYHYEEAVFLTK